MGKTNISKQNPNKIKTKIYFTSGTEKYKD